MSRKSLRNASLALGSVTFGLTGLLHAQNAQPDVPAPTTATAQGADQLQEIAVTGIRGSLQRAWISRRSRSVSWMPSPPKTSASFPTASIGEAIARIPGVTVNRGSINAMASAGAPTSTGQVTE